MSLHQRITDLRAAGLTLAQIGKHVRLDASTVQYHLHNRRRGLPAGRGNNSRNPPPTVEQIAMELTAIREADRAARAARPPEQTKEARRQARMAGLDPRIREARRVPGLLGLAC